MSATCNGDNSKGLTGAATRPGITTKLGALCVVMLDAAESGDPAWHVTSGAASTSMQCTAGCLEAARLRGSLDGNLQDGDKHNLS
jgi:hypothetical protein